MNSAKNKTRLKRRGESNFVKIMRKKSVQKA